MWGGFILGPAFCLRHILCAVVIRQSRSGRRLRFVRCFRLYRVSLNGLLCAAGVRVLSGIGLTAVGVLTLNIYGDLLTGIAIGCRINVYGGIVAACGIVRDCPRGDVRTAAETGDDPTHSAKKHSLAIGGAVFSMWLDLCQIASRFFLPCFSSLHSISRADRSIPFFK